MDNDRLKNYILVGFMGSGKTRIGRELAKMADMTFYDTDELIEKAAGKKIRQIFREEGEASFRERETKLIRGLVDAHSEGGVYSTGGGLAMREENRKLLHQLGTVIFLDIDFDTAWSRLQNDTKRPLLQTPDRAGTILRLLDERRPLYLDAADLIVRADNTAPRHKVKEILTRSAQAGKSD